MVVVSFVNEHITVLANELRTGVSGSGLATKFTCCLLVHIIDLLIDFGWSLWLWRLFKTK
jgi:hypothetical protein